MLCLTQGNAQTKSTGWDKITGVKGAYGTLSLLCLVNSSSKIKISRHRNSTAAGNDVEWWPARAMNESSVKKSEKLPPAVSGDAAQLPQLRASSPQQSREMRLRSLPTRADPPNPEISRVDPFPLPAGAPESRRQQFLPSSRHTRDEASLTAKRSGKPSNHSGGSRALEAKTPSASPPPDPVDLAGGVRYHLINLS